MTTDIMAALSNGIDLSERDLSSLCETLDYLSDVRLDLDDTIDLIEAEIVERMETDQLDVPGLGTVTRTEKTTQRLHHADSTADYHDHLVQAIADYIGTDKITGEVDEIRRRTAAAAAEAVVTHISIGKPKRSASRELNIRASNYWERVHAGYAVKIQRELDGPE